MEKATVIEIVLFKAKESIKTEDAQKELMRLNRFLERQAGYIFRKTAISSDNEYLDIVYWKDLTSAQAAAGKAEKDPEALEIFSVIGEQSVFKHYEIFNDTMK